MSDRNVREKLLQPYFGWGIERFPAIYLFIEKRQPLDGGESYLEVEYVGQAMVLCERVKYGRHHRLVDGYHPNHILYLPLWGADALDLDAAEGLFIWLYRPRMNGSHMPRPDVGEEDRWAKRLVKRLTPIQKREFYGFLANSLPEIPDEGRHLADVLGRELAAAMTFEEQVTILQSLQAKH